MRCKLTLSIAVLLAATVSAEQYDLGPTDVNCGGTRSAGGVYTLDASTAQGGGVGVIRVPPDGFPYEFNDGFWYCVLAGTDCNGNGVSDDVDIGDGTSPDCNGNGIPDECDIDPNDPDGDGTTSDDCQPNGVPDECDIDPNDPGGDGEVSRDCFWGGSDGVPDECQCIGDIVAYGDGVTISDLAHLLAHYGLTVAVYEDGDLDCDGDVDLADLAELLARYGDPCDWVP
jgi:hypothetical protein